ncbi:Tetratricopeptide repeat protein 19-like protein [Dinothrombium tinctorium]|uniref:Tetratricopeptide repeat protein 19-like protein n=1 Tax=Dinothrombium tinctorium TaxID=1965070 RepID=A0A443RB32_9ACAR|nr:Tetratricopeptide repeat protein 19-like protein [Dinothrombium tinctorium]
MQRSLRDQRNRSLIRSYSFCFQIFYASKFETLNSLSICRAFTGLIESLLVLLGFQDELAKEDPFILTIKRGILCMQREEYDKAELILHTALKMAQDLMHEKAITYIFALLANNSFEKKDYKKAENLYKVVMSRVLANGAQENDESIIEMSLKLAKIYSERNENVNAEHGFKFCLSHQEKRIKDIDVKSELTKEEENSLALYGMITDWYSKHLLKIGDKENSLKHANIAYDISVNVNGIQHPQTITLLNDIGSIHFAMHHFEQSIEYFQKAVRLGILANSDNLATFYHNLGIAYLQVMKKHLAHSACLRSLELATESENIDGINKAKECLAETDKLKV